LAHLNANNTFIVVFFGLILLLAGIILYYIEYAINAAVNLLLETITLGIWNNSKPVFSEYQLPSALIGIGLICIAIPFLIYFGGTVERILRERTFSMKDSAILTAASFIMIRFVDFTTTSLHGIDRTIPYIIMGVGFIGIILPSAMFVGVILNHRVRKKRALSVKDFPKIIGSLGVKDFLWIISSGVTLIVFDYLLGKAYYDDKGDIPRIVADFGYVYVIIPLSIYLHGIIKNRIRSKKTFNLKDIVILFAVGLASTAFIGLNVNMGPNTPFSIDTEPHIGEKFLHFALYFLGAACIIMALANVIRGMIKISKRGDLVMIKKYPASIIEYARNNDIINEIKKVWK